MESRETKILAIEWNRHSRRLPPVRWFLKLTHAARHSIYRGEMSVSYKIFHQIDIRSMTVMIIEITALCEKLCDFLKTVSPRIIQVSFQREDEDMSSSLYTQRQKEVIRIRICKSGTIWSANKHFKFVRISQN